MMLQNYHRNYINTVVRANPHPASTANVKFCPPTQTSIRIATLNLYEWNVSNIINLTIVDNGKKMAFNLVTPTARIIRLFYTTLLYRVKK